MFGCASSTQYDFVFDLENQKWVKRPISRIENAGFNVKADHEKKTMDSGGLGIPVEIRR